MRILRSGEDWLVQQTLHYARCRGFSRFAPTLEAAWRQVVWGLTDALAEGLRFHEDAPELEPVLDLEADPLVTFVVREALLHQDRGLELSMFLGLFKYIRQAYAGFLVQQVSAGERLDEFQALLSRSFDRMEVAVCQAWTRRSAPELAEAARERARDLLNEKNAYLTVFESLSDPAFLVDERGMVRNLNHAAVRMLGALGRPGAAYYGAREPAAVDPEGEAVADPASPEPPSLIGAHVRQLVPFLPPIEGLIKGESPEASNLGIRGHTSQGLRDFQVLISPMLDVSSRLLGAVLIFQDVTERLELEGHLRFLATTDALTGVANRRSLLRRAEHEFQRARRYDRPLAMLLLDIDHFKHVNDTWGHFAGDEALKALCGACLANLRGSDVLGRLGGEEFAVLLPETGIREACETAERFRHVVEQLRVDWHGRTVAVTVSIGVAAIEAGDDDVYALMRRADLALYTAKDVGRNRVVLCSDEPSAAAAAGEQVEFVLDGV
ncbi:MAG: diguanylate cyclase [Pseudomonadota bacterium]